MSDPLLEAIREGAITALTKRRDALTKDYKTRNAMILMGGKTPEEEPIYERNKALFDLAIDDMKTLDLEAACRT